MKQLFLVIIGFTLLISQTSLAFKFTPEICMEYGLGKNWYCGEKDEDNAETATSKITAKDILDSKLPAEEKAIQINLMCQHFSGQLVTQIFVFLHIPLVINNHSQNEF